MRLNVLRENEYLSPERPFDILASDVNLLIELTPGGMVRSNLWMPDVHLVLISCLAGRDSNYIEYHGS